MSTIYSTGKQHGSDTWNPEANNNQKKDGSEGKNDIDRNKGTSTTSKEERTTIMTATTDKEETAIESVTVATTPRIIIVEEMTKDAQNDGST